MFFTNEKESIINCNQIIFLNFPVSWVQNCRILIIQVSVCVWDCIFYVCTFLLMFVRFCSCLWFVIKYLQQQSWGKQGNEKHIKGQSQSMPFYSCLKKKKKKETLTIRFFSLKFLYFHTDMWKPVSPSLQLMHELSNCNRLKIVLKFQKSIINLFSFSFSIFSLIFSISQTYSNISSLSINTQQIHKQSKNVKCQNSSKNVTGE